MHSNAKLFRKINFKLRSMLKVLQHPVEVWSSNENLQMNANDAFIYKPQNLTEYFIKIIKSK